jgi:fatty acid-binding protein DegV
MALFIDSTTVLPESWIREHDVTVLPVPIWAGGREYRDGIDITDEGFMTLLETSKERPSTAVPAIGEFASWFEKLLQTHDVVIYPVASARLSGLLNAAVQAAKEIAGAQVVVLDGPQTTEQGLYAINSTDADLEDRLARLRTLGPPLIVVMDTTFVSGGAALIAMRALEVIHRGAEIDQVIHSLITAKEKTGLYFILPKLDYVVDRVGQLQVFVGTLLRIKPVLMIRDGMVQDAAKVRGEGKARRQMLELVRQKVSDRPVDVFVLHSLAPEMAHELLDKAKTELNIRRAWVGGIGCTVSRYTGREGLGIAFVEV